MERLTYWESLTIKQKTCLILFNVLMFSRYLVLLVNVNGYCYKYTILIPRKERFNHINFSETYTVLDRPIQLIEREVENEWKNSIHFI